MTAMALAGRCREVKTKAQEEMVKKGRGAVGTAQEGFVAENKEEETVQEDTEATGTEEEWKGVVSKEEAEDRREEEE